MHAAKVEQISYLDLEDLPILRQLDIRENRIQTIPADLLWHNPRFQQISLSANPIRNIEKSVFDFRYDLVTLAVEQLT
jgi:Leucine rich repeat